MCYLRILAKKSVEKLVFQELAELGTLLLFKVKNYNNDNHHENQEFQTQKDLPVDMEGCTAGICSAARMPHLHTTMTAIEIIYKTGMHIFVNLNEKTILDTKQETDHNHES